MVVSGFSRTLVIDNDVMIVMQPVGVVRSPYSETSQIPKGCGAEHKAEGVLEIESQFEAGLADIEVSRIST